MKWTDIALAGGHSKEWPTAALLEQMTLSRKEFGDGIMSAIDFSMDLQREPDPKGDRFKIMLNVKFLPYETY